MKRMTMLALALATMLTLALMLSGPAFAGATRLTLLASGAQTASANGASFNVPNLRELACIVDVTAGGGGAALIAIYLEGSADGGTTFSELAADLVQPEPTPSAPTSTPTASIINQRNMIGTVGGQFTPIRAHAKYATFDDTIRARWIVTAGTNQTWTFSIRCVGK